MKKCLALLLALMMMLAVSGCAESLQGIEIPPLPQITPTPGPTFFVPASSENESGNNDDQQSIAQGIVIPGNSGQETVSTENEDAAPSEQQPQSGFQVIIPATTDTTPVQEEASTIYARIQRTELLENDPEMGTELILDFSYDVTRIFWDENPALAEKINEKLATIEDAYYTGNSNGLTLSFLGFNQMLEMAEDNYTYVKEYETEGILEMSDSLSVQVQRLDSQLFSILYSESIYTGGVHGSYVQTGVTFDMSTGEILTLEQLSDDYAALEEHLVQTMLRMAQEDADGYYSARIVDEFLPAGGREEAFRALLREGAWTFDRDGMVISSLLYELGPYAAGITEFHIPYGSLDGRIKDEYLPPAGRTGSGTLSVSALGSVSLPILDKVVTEPDGQQLALAVEGRVYDLRISRVLYADRFYEQAQLWAASTLENCALQLQTVVPEGIPNLMITYYTADGRRHGKLISQSGLDGSFLLVDDNIQPVG